MKKHLIKVTIILSMLLLTLIPLSVNAERAFGNLTCDIDYKGTLTINGTGEMQYNPWQHIKDQWGDDIKSIVISSGVTSICDQAFSGCANLQNVTMADTVTTIGSRAFFDCKNLSNVTLSKNLTTIDHFAFLRCENLMTFSIPEGVFIGDGILCETGIESITIPDTMDYIPDYTFDGCENLKKNTYSQWRKNYRRFII